MGFGGHIDKVTVISLLCHFMNVILCVPRWNSATNSRMNSFKLNLRVQLHRPRDWSATASYWLKSCQTWCRCLQTTGWVVEKVWHKPEMGTVCLQSKSTEDNTLQKVQLLLWKQTFQLVSHLSPFHYWSESSWRLFADKLPSFNLWSTTAIL